ncbi:MAG: adenylate/guanylate cyclase domain-containing protein [Alphaproteobacteria bacterium]
MTTGDQTRKVYKPARTPVMVLLVLLLLAGLPFSVWLDLRSLSERNLRNQADEVGALINGVRAFYGRNIVGRVLAHNGQTRVVHNYLETPGAIPIPATLSLELGRLVSEQDGKVRYRFVSDYPFANREPHALDAFEKDALARLRKDAKLQIYDVVGSIFDQRVRLVTAVTMGEACVSCHNVHPESPKKDWKVGDVRGIQEFIINQPIAANIFAFKYLLFYFAIAALLGLSFIFVQRRQALAIQGANRELETANDFLASISMKIAKYLSPQIYKSIFSGQKDVSIATERKKLTIFFSDIKDFTATTERLQPEELTQLLNEYLTEMSDIALKHGGTLDKFIGDAILVFFGDPETKGVEEDAKECMRMAIDMQRRLVDLNSKWRTRGVEQPFKVRMGINTGFCNVGNFGSSDRMDYTIIGAEANLAARLQSIAEPGGIVISYETYALVRNMVHARTLPPITMKGISREIVPYAVEGMIGEQAEQRRVIAEHTPGMDLFLDVDLIDDKNAERAMRVLADAVLALDNKRKARGEPPKT